MAGVVAAASSAQSPQSPRSEVVVKSEFVLRFPEFVEWPNADRDLRPLSLCLSASHPFGSSIQASTTRQSSGKRIAVRELQRNESVRACDIVYVAPAELPLLDSVRDQPVLTIGDHPQFCQRGGIINLLVIDGRVRFEVDLARARRAGLKLDSQLLRLASKVYGGMP